MMSQSDFLKNAGRWGGSDVAARRYRAAVLSNVPYDEDAAKPGAVLKSSNVTPSYLVFKGGSYDQTFEQPAKCP